MSRIPLMMQVGLLLQAALLAGVLTTAAALAQSDDQTAPPAGFSAPPNGEAAPPNNGSARPNNGVRRFIERFQAANTTGDGHLTLAQAQVGHMPMIVRNFDAIDTQHRGYVTLRDIRAWRQQVRAEQRGGSGNGD